MFCPQPVFDGRSNLYTRDPLPIGNEKMELEVSFVTIIMFVNLYHHHNKLQSGRFVSFKVCR